MKRPRTIKTDAIQRLRKLCKKATPEPWFISEPNGDWWNDKKQQIGEADLSGADEKLVLAARNALPLLLDLAEAAKGFSCYMTSGKHMLPPHEVLRDNLMPLYETLNALRKAEL